ncbi:hypothetical protein ONZ45_g5165 [Pleurotus djamor]|nr:hypothetical protein ONZ45_g5165 [Pleurotus djamor]
MSVVLTSESQDVYGDGQAVFLLRKSSLVGLWVATLLYGIYVVLFAACIYIFWTNTKSPRPEPLFIASTSPHHLSPPPAAGSTTFKTRGIDVHRRSHQPHSFPAVSSPQTKPTINLPLQVSAVFMFGLSTAHMILDIITTLGMDVETGLYVRPTALAGVYLHLTNSAIADCVIIYRCYIVWGFNKYFILPMILVLTTTVYGYTMGLSVGTISLTLGTNIIVTGLTAGRLWWGARQTAKVFGKEHKDKYSKATAIVLESGAIYSLSLLVFLVLMRLELGTRRSVPANTYACELPKSYVIYLIVSQLVGIIPTLIIVRVGLNVPTFQRTDETSSQASLSEPRDHLFPFRSIIKGMTEARRAIPPQSQANLSLPQSSLSHPPLPPMNIAFTTEISTFSDEGKQGIIQEETASKTKEDY